MTRIRILFTALLFLGSVAGPAQAHRDTILSRKSDGSVPEIPANLGKVTLDIAGLGTGNATIRLTVGANSATLPPCFTRLIRTRDVKDLMLRGSWYHDEQSGLPSYIEIRFIDPDAKRGHFIVPGQRFLFSLRDAKLIHFGGVKAYKSGLGGEGYILKVPAGCEIKYEVAPAHETVRRPRAVP